LIEEIIEEAVEASSLEDPLEECIAQFGEDLDLDKLLEKADAILESATLVSSEEETTVSEPTKKEPKPRLDNLEYEFLGPADCLLVSIASELISVQEKKVLDVLREHKEAIGWTIEDTEQQRRLNPAIQEVEKAEVIIHPIFDSKCVSSIHVMPKWAGLLRVKTTDDEFVPTRIWKAWIDYHKVNAAMRKDYFSRPFIWPMVEHVAGNEYSRQPCGMIQVTWSDCSLVWEVWLKTENLVLVISLALFDSRPF